MFFRWKKTKKPRFFKIGLDSPGIIINLCSGNAWSWPRTRWNIRLTRTRYTVLNSQLTKLLNHGPYMPGGQSGNDKYAERDPENRISRRAIGRAFQKESSMVSRALVWSIAVLLTRGKNRIRINTCQSKVRIGRCEVAYGGERMWSQRYFGATLNLDLRRRTRILYWIRAESQRNWFIRNEGRFERIKEGEQ